MRYNQRIEAINDHYIRAYMRYIWRQVHRNKFGFFGVYTGLPGMGKTESAMMKMWFQDETFDESSLKERLCRRPKQFLNAINNLDRFMWAAWMDVGLSTNLSARNWQKITNAVVNDSAMIMRIKDMGIVFDSQIVGYIDKSTRSLFQWFYEVNRFENNPPVINIHKIRVNQRYNNVYFPHPIFRIGGRMVKLSRMTIKGRLPKVILNKFDDLQIAAKEKVLKQHHDMMDMMEQRENPKTVYEMVNEVHADVNSKAVKKKFKNKNGTIDISLIMAHFKIGRGKADQVKKLVEQTL